MCTLSSLVSDCFDGESEALACIWRQCGMHSLCGARNHVLDEVTMARGIDDRVVVVVGEELLGGAFDGHTTLTLILLGVHVESESEGTLTDLLGYLLKLVHLTLGDTSQLEKETASGGRLARVDVTADNNAHVLLFLSHDSPMCVCGTW